MKRGLEKGAIAVAVLLLLAVFSYLIVANIHVSLQYTDLENRYNELTNEYNAYKEDAVTAIKTLTEDSEVISDELLSLSRKHDSLQNKYLRLESARENILAEIEETMKKIDNYDTDLRKSMSWLRENAEIDNSGNKMIKEYLEENCIRESKSTCEIRLGCIDLINSRFMNYTYKDDTITSKTADQLQSISEFNSNSGGDCEDYSLLYKAEYNHLLSSCEGKEITLFSWSKEKGKKHPLDVGKKWHRKNAETEILEGYSYPNVICGKLYDLNKGSITGHCVVAFTENRITDTDSMFSELNHAPLIEPQNGGFLGYINDESSKVYLPGSANDKESDAYIFEVITDSDLYLHSKKHNEWLSFSELSGELASHREKINLLQQAG